MKLLKWICFVLSLLVVIYGCQDEEKELESLKVYSEDASPDLSEYPCTLYDYKQFVATGYYNDDSSEDLTEEVTWSEDSTDDVLVDDIPGLVHCAQTGSFLLIAKYTIQVSSGGYTTTNDSEENEIMGYAVIKITE